MNYTIYFIIAGLLVLLVSQISWATPKVGDQAPNFKAQDETGAWRTLADFGAGKIVLYFYPKDDTPGCTKQACSLRDGFTHLQEQNITIIGVSFDSPASHQQFKTKYNLPFTLLSDANKSMAHAYGTYRWFTWFMPKRYTFLINKGRIVAILKDVDVRHHSDQVIQAFEHSA